MSTNPGTTAGIGPTRGFIWLAYLAAFAGVASHASSEFVVKLTGLMGAEVSVWRFTLGGLALLIVALSQRGSRDLITPLRQDPVPVIGLSIFGMTLGQFLFHWALDYAKCEGWTNFHVDQLAHVLCKIGYVVYLSSLVS